MNTQGNVFFTSPEHQQRFERTVQQIGKVYDGAFDPEYSAALYILTSHSGLCQKTQNYVSRSGINFIDMLQEVDFSGGHGVLIRLAGNLFYSSSGLEDACKLDPVEIPTRLDNTNFTIALTALLLRRHGYRVEQSHA